MYKSVWLTLGIGLLVFVLALIFLMRDYRAVVQAKQSGLKLLVPNWLLLLTAVGWFVVAFMLYNAIQGQLMG